MFQEILEDNFEKQNFYQSFMQVFNKAAMYFGVEKYYFVLLFKMSLCVCVLLLLLLLKYFYLNLFV